MVTKKGMTLDIETNTIDLEINTMIGIVAIDIKNMEGATGVREEIEDKDMIEEETEETETMGAKDTIEIEIIIGSNNHNSKPIHQESNHKQNKNQSNSTDLAI